jgi:hypothetical protein
MQRGSDAVTVVSDCSIGRVDQGRSRHVFRAMSVSMRGVWTKAGAACIDAMGQR